MKSPETAHKATKPEDMRALARKSAEDIWNHGKIELIDKLYGPGFMFFHPNMPKPIIGPAGYKEFVKAYRKAFPDFRVDVERIVLEGDTMVLRWAAHGTHLGDLEFQEMKVPATKKPVTWTGVTICRIDGGKFVEDRMWSDTLTLWEQLGVLPKAMAAKAH
jgi:steroid delta-isomerase-like uncharacterized protein